jgi:hypothetical protein
MEKLSKHGVNFEIYNEGTVKTDERGISLRKKTPKQFTH